MTSQRFTNRIWQSFKLWSLVFVVLWAYQSTLQAQYSNNDNYPTKPNRGNGKLLVRTQMETSETAGFVEFQITSGAPSKAERQLELVVYLSNGSGNRAVRKKVVFPQGSMGITERLHFSQSVPTGVWESDIFEDGRNIRDRTKQATNIGRNLLIWNTNNFSTSIFIFDKNDGTAATEFREVYSGGLRSNSKYTPFWNAKQLDVDSLSERWGDLLQYETCIIPAATLKNLKKKRPKAFKSLLKYVYAGGTVVVLNVNSLGAGLDSFEKLVNIAPANRGILTALQSAKEQWWTIYSYELDEPEETEDTSNMYGGISYQSQMAVESEEPKKKAKTEEEIQTNITLEGLLADSSIVAETYLQVEFINHFDSFLDVADMLDVDTIEWQLAYSNKRYKIMQQAQSEAYYAKYYGFGAFLLIPQKLSELSNKTQRDISDSSYSGTISTLSVNGDGNWLWRNLIQSVGKPPVWTFCLAVALFSLVLGPGLLFLTGQKKRRSLMMFLVPAVSLLAAGLILIYNVVYEGFDNYVRTSSIQVINEDEDQSFIWSRQNIFAGSPPREGLVFPAEVFSRSVRKVEASYYGGDPRRNIQWTASWNQEGNTIWRNWLSSRQQQQLLIGHPSAKAKVPIEVARLDQGEVEVTNVSGTALPLVVFRGEGDDYYWLENLAADESKIVESTDVFSAGANVARVMDDFNPKPPSELRNSSTLYEYARGRSSNYLYDDSSDLIQRHLESHFSDRLMMEPFEYATFNRDTSDSFKPIDGITEDMDLHLIIGRKPW